MKNELLKGMKRSDYCNNFSMANVGQEVTVFGWVAKERNMGQLIFVDLRDITGIIQLAFDDTTDKAVFEKASQLKNEYVIAAKGTVRERSSKNKEIPTGDIEVFVTELRVVGQSKTLPFEIDDNCKASEKNRLKYRYLDLRRPCLQKNLITRAKISKETRNYFEKNGFIEIETPMLIGSTPEGARDFLVPSRIHNGSFYALPQSPQLYKQLLMVAGFDRYIQLARCFRDEDLRADRQPEFTQIDMEMSFVDVEDILEMGEGFIKHLFKTVLGVDMKDPIPRITFSDAMELYGSDKPDTRFEMLIHNISDVVKNSGFGVFESAINAGGCVKAICAKDSVSKFTRKEIDKLTEVAKGWGAKGVAWVRMTEEGPKSSFGKFVSEEVMNNIITEMDAKTGDTIFIIGDVKKSIVVTCMGLLRLEVAKILDVIENSYNLLWVVEMPFFELDEDTGKYVAMHHPFTAPLDECIDKLDSDPSAVKAKCYDLVLNGVELCSGSMRITDPELQRKMFSALGLTEEEAERKFGFLTHAYEYGAPPHGGLAMGIDRIAMLFTGSSSLRDVVAFPKLQNATEAMTNCPNIIDNEQLKELGIAVINTEKEQSDAE